MFLLSILLPKYHISVEMTRKVIHIAISNWWLIAMIFFTNTFIALIPPISFLILNYFSYHYNIVTGIERVDKQELGTIYYPLSLIILIIFTFGYLQIPYIGAIGILIMGYGDGIATIMGYHFGKKKLYKNKTYVGSISMFIISFITTFILLWIFNPIHLLLYSFTIAIVATLAELFSSKGFDNLSVPLSTTLIYFLLFSF